MAASAGPNPSERAYFEAMFDADEDPWKFATRGYERRKRDVTLALLPTESYSYGFEPGCATGELSAALATRCHRLLVSDGVDKAVEIARRRLAALHNVEVRKAWLPDEWPDAQFDLIVLSEFLFYLTPDTVREIAARVLQTLKPEGTVLACHWRLPIEDCVVSGDSAHDMLHEAFGLPRVSQLLEPEFRIDVWSEHPSAAVIDGLVK